MSILNKVFSYVEAFAVPAVVAGFLGIFLFNPTLENLRLSLAMIGGTVIGGEIVEGIYKLEEE